jgi:hypothetical protein
MCSKGKCKCKKTKQFINDILELEKLEEKKKYESKVIGPRNKFAYDKDYGSGSNHKRFEYQPKWGPNTGNHTTTNKVSFTIAPPKASPISKLNLDALVIALDAVELLVKKHKDYGPRNIADAPGGALNGLSVRLHDKVARLAHLVSNNKEPENESLKDTFVDILNYGIIGLLVLEDKWDK